MSQARPWWREVIASDWTAFSLPEDLVRERYTAVLAALEELSTRGPMSTLADVLEQLRAVGFHDPLSEVELRALLDQLATWGFTEPFRDFAAPVRDYRGVVVRREAWALTKRGRTIVAAVHAAVTSADRALQLPSRLLDSVEQTVRQLSDHAVDPGQHGLLDADLSNIATRIAELQRVTADFYDALGQLVQSDVTRDEVFDSNRDRVVEALRQFAREYDRALPRVDDALAVVAALGHRHILVCAVEHAGLLEAAAQQDWIDERLRRLSSLEAWFLPQGSIHGLIDSAHGAVGTLLNAVDRRYNARVRGSDLSVDFRVLARSLHAQPDDAHAQRVFAAAFGDWPAWHAIGGPRQESVEQAATAASSTPVFDVELTLREHERHGPAGGRPHKVADTAAERARAQAEDAEQAQRRARIAARLLTDGEVGLEHFAGLDAELSSVLFDAVLAAIDSADEHGHGRADAGDAGVIVEVTLPDADTRERALVRLAEGELVAPGLRVQVSSSVAAPSPPEVAPSADRADAAAVTLSSSGRSVA